MKIITCGSHVTYIIYGSHIATIVYNYNDGAPSATIYYDGKLGEIVEAENGQTMRFAMRLAIWSIKWSQHCDQLRNQ